MAIVPTGVAIVSIETPNGVKSCTISSLISVDVINPQVLFALKNNSQTLKVIAETKFFSICVLSEFQRAYSLKFSSQRSNGDSTNDFSFESKYGLPILKDSSVVFLCQVEEFFQLQNASIVLAKVLSHSSDSGINPLIYQNRKYFQLGDEL